MPKFRTQKQVCHSAKKMFALVADIERYPEFLPMCESLTIRSRREENGNILLVADMSVGYKLVRESFTTQVYLQPAACRIDVQYIDGPFKYLQNRWQFLPLGAEGGEGAAAGPGDSGAAGAVGTAMKKGITESQRAGHAAADNANAAALGAAEITKPGIARQRAETASHNKEAGAASWAEAAETGGAISTAGLVAKVATADAVGGTAADQAAGAAESCIVDFYIDYAFKNPMLSMLMGAMFDIAFRKFTAAFITRADEIYGANG